MAEQRKSECPGCGLQMPIKETAARHRYINASPECWDLYTEVLAVEYGDAMLFQQVHQLTVDSYVAQHPGSKHPDKSVGIHLCGLYLMLERDVSPGELPRIRQHLAERVEAWPSFPPPSAPAAVRVWDVALADSSEYVDTVRRWAQSVWQTWRGRHQDIGALVARHVGDV